MILETWFLAFALTLAVEAIVVFVLAKISKFRMPWLEVLVLNLVTHPVAFVFATGETGFWLIEGVVILLEAAGYKILLDTAWRRAALLSTFANGMSLMLGFAWGLFQ